MSVKYEIYSILIIANLIVKAIHWQKSAEIQRTKIFLHPQRHLQTVNISEAN